MEMLAVLKLRTALNLNLIADIIQAGERHRTVLGQLAPRHLLGRATAAEKHARHADDHHDAEDADTGGQATQTRRVHRDDDADDTNNQKHRQHDPPQTARRRNGCRNRLVDSDLAARSSRWTGNRARTSERMRGHQITLTTPGDSHLH